MVARQKSILCTSDRRGHAWKLERKIGAKSFREALMKEFTITNQKMVSNENTGSNWKKVHKKNMTKPIDRKYKQENYEHAGL